MSRINNNRLFSVTASNATTTSLDIPFGGFLPVPQMLMGDPSADNLTFCGRVNIMGTIVQDAAPYLFPFIIEYSLIGAAVIYIMWRHIGRHPRHAFFIFFDRSMLVLLILQ